MYIKCIFFLVIHITTLQGAGLEEIKSQTALRYQHLRVTEKPDNNSSIEETETDTQSPKGTPSLRLLEAFDVTSSGAYEEENICDDSRSMSNHYMSAFQENFEQSISKFLTFKAIASLLIGFGPSIPQLAIALKVGEHYRSPLLGYFILATTILTIEGVTSWLIWELIDDTQKLLSTPKLSRKTSRLCNTHFAKGIGIGALSFFLGALSSMPDVYKAYKYNTVKELAIISFIYDTIPRTLGFYKLFSSLTCSSRHPSKEDLAIIKKGKEVIDLSKNYFLHLCKKAGIANISADLHDYDTPKKLYTYLSSDFQSETIDETTQRYSPATLKKIAQYCALIFPSASAGFNTVLAYKGYNLFITNPILLSLLSGFSVLPTYFLSSYVIMQAAGSLFDKVYNRRSLNLNSDYFSTFHPCTNISFIITPLALEVITSIGGFYIVSDNLDDTFLSSAKYGFASLGIITDVTFGTYTIYSTLTNFGKLTQKVRDTKSNYVLGCLEKLDKIKDEMESSDTLSVNNFINDVLDEE